MTRTVFLGGIVKYITDKMPVSEVLLEDYISTENLLPDKGGVILAANLPQSGKVTKYLRGDVLVSNIRPYFKKIWFANHDGGASNDVLVFRSLGDSLISEYLYYILANDNFFNYSTASSGGSKMPRGDKIQIMKYPVYLPPVEMQKKIADILSSLDEKIELNRKMNETLEKMGQALFRHYFIDNPEAEKWRSVTVRDLIQIRNGFAFKSEDYVESGVPIVRTTNFTADNTIILQDSVYISVENAKKYNNFQLEERDLLVVMVGASLGKTVITPSNILPALQNQNMWCFRACSEKHKNYIVYIMKRLIAENVGSSSGSAREFFRKDYFYKLNLKLPCDEVINQFNVDINPIFSLIDSNISEIQTLTSLRDALLPRLLSNKIEA